MNNYFCQIYTQKNKNNYNIEMNNVNYLVLMACHCDSNIKLNTIKIIYRI